MKKVKAPGQGGDILLTRGERVEVQWPNGNRLLRYVDEGGYQVDLRHVGSATPVPWGDGRIVRVLTEDKPADTDTADAAYLSGPMTGLPDFNRPAFHAAAAALRAQGHEVINPAEVDLGPDASWADYMRVHLTEIARRVTRVFVLPGWEGSRGAQLEVHVARALGLPVEPVLTEDKPAQETGLPRQIKPEDVRPGMVIETRTQWEATSGIVNGRFEAVESSGGVCMGRRCEFWLIEDAPVDPDAAAIEAIITAYRRSPECSTDSAFGEAMLDHLRAQGFDVTPRAEQ